MYTCFLLYSDLQDNRIRLRLHWKMTLQVPQDRRASLDLCCGNSTMNNTLLLRFIGGGPREREPSAATNYDVHFPLGEMLQLARPWCNGGTCRRSSPFWISDRPRPGKYALDYFGQANVCPHQLSGAQSVWV